MAHTPNDRETSFLQARPVYAVSKNEFYGGAKALSRYNGRYICCYLITGIILILVIVLPPVQVNAQIKIRQYIVSGSLLFASGCSDGITETLAFHYYDGFKRVFPNSKDQFWDPSISWQNKYKNNNPDEGPKYFGSTTIFVGFTDGYHMTRMARNSFVFGAIAFKIGEPKQKWYYYVAQFVAGGIVYKAGFWTSYELVFHQ